MKMKIKLYLVCVILVMVLTVAQCKKITPLAQPYTEPCDSLRNELFIQQLENGRYQIILDRLYEHDSTLYYEITKDLE